MFILCKSVAEVLNWGGHKDESETFPSKRRGESCTYIIFIQVRSNMYLKKGKVGAVC